MPKSKANFSVVNDELIDWVIKEEGFLNKPTDIGDGKVTIGSGLTDPKWIEKYKKKGYWSKEDNRKAVAEELQKRSDWAKDTLPNWETLPINAKRAMLSYKYNYDFTRDNSPKLFGAMESGNFIEAIRQMDATSKNPKFKKGLQARREREQQWGLQGLFDKPSSDRKYEYPDATTVINPYVAKVQNITFTDQAVPTNPSDNLIEAEKVSAEVNEYDKVRRALDAQAAFRRLIQDNAWENQEPKKYVPSSGINYIVDPYAEGGNLNKKKLWDELSMKEKADMMRVAIENGITTLPEIKKQYNEFAEGGDYTVGGLVDAIYKNNPTEEYLGEPEHHYNFTQPEEWADAHGYFPDARGHRDDRIKKPAHPSHHSRGNWRGNVFNLTEKGMQDPNYTIFGLVDGGQDPQAILTYKGGIVLPEITVTPNGNYIENPYDNIRLHYKALGGPIVREANYYGLGDWLRKAYHSAMQTVGLEDTPVKSITYRGRPAVEIGSKVVPKRISRNNSPTQIESEKKENIMRDYVVKQQSKAGGSDPAFDIPFIKDKKVILGGSTTSTNVLDSLAKYAAIHNAAPQYSEHPIYESNMSKYASPRPINIDEMLGLAYNETKNGAMPYLNMFSGDEHKKENREIGNSNYFTAFGYIPADNLVRNFHYNNTAVDRAVPPLLDAFQYYAQGDYNRGNSNHKSIVVNAGKSMWKNKQVQNWWNTSDPNAGKNLYNHWYTKTKNGKAKKK